MRPTPNHRKTLRNPFVILFPALLLVALAVPATAMAQGEGNNIDPGPATTPAGKQYGEQLPNAGGGQGGKQGGGGGARDGGSGQGQGQDAGKGQGEAEGEPGDQNKQGTESGALAALEDEGDDGGGIGTAGIILIILAVLIVGGLAIAWLRGRRGPAPDAP